MAKKPSLTEQKITRTKEFLDQWVVFHEMFVKARTDEPITREEEDRFLKVKSDLARKHQILMEFLDKEYIDKEPITNILRATVNLRTVSQSAYDHYVRIETWWHNTFLALNESLGNLRYKLEGAP